MGDTPNSWIIMENNLKMDDLVPPRLRKPPKMGGIFLGCPGFGDLICQHGVNSRFPAGFSGTHPKGKAL